MRWRRAPADCPAAISSPHSPAAPQSAGSQIGQGQVKVGLILPLGAPGNAGVTAQSMRNAAELALSEFNNPDIQLLVKDDGGSAPGAQQAAQQLLDEGAEIILGPLFAHSVAPVGQLARARGIPVIAFSTDSNVAASGVYLLSFLPESDVDRLVTYAAQQGKRSFAAALPDNPYGTVVEAAFKQSVGRRNGRIVALERYTSDRTQIQAMIKKPRARGERRRRDLHSGHRRHRAVGRADPECERRRYPQGPDARQRPVGGPADFLQRRSGRRLVRGAGLDRFPEFLRPLPQPSTIRTRCAPRRWSMTRSRWSPR